MAHSEPDPQMVRILARLIGRLLDPGEEVHYAFRAVSGRHVRWLVSGWKMFANTNLNKPVLYAVGVRTYIVGVTNASIVIAEDRLRGAKLVARLPRATRLGPFIGNGWIEVGGMTLCIPGVEGMTEVRLADSEMGFDDPGPVSSWFGNWSWRER